MCGVGDVPLPARCVLLPAVVQLSFQLWTRHAVTLLCGAVAPSGLHLLIWATQILVVLYLCCITARGQLWAVPSPTEGQNALFHQVLNYNTCTCVKLAPWFGVLNA